MSYAGSGYTAEQVRELSKKMSDDQEVPDANRERLPAFKVPYGDRAADFEADKKKESKKNAKALSFMKGKEALMRQIGQSLIMCLDNLVRGDEIVSPRAWAFIVEWAIDQIELNATRTYHGKQPRFFDADQVAKFREMKGAWDELLRNREFFDMCNRVSSTIFAQVHTYFVKYTELLDALNVIEEKIAKASGAPKTPSKRKMPASDLIIPEFVEQSSSSSSSSSSKKKSKANDGES